VAGILYVHRISDNRMQGTSLKTLRLLVNLCGVNAMSSVCLVTTMWDEVAEATGVRREAELEERFWKEMMDNGCKNRRFDNTFDSAWDSVADVVRNSSGRPLRLQEEMGGDNRRLSETAAYNGIQEGSSNKLMRWFRRKLRR
jgi:hypothetical protein